MDRRILAIIAVFVVLGAQLGIPTVAAGSMKCFGHEATIAGTAGDDLLIGTGRADVIVAGAGTDRVEGGGGDDIICLGPGGSPRNQEGARGDGGNDIL